jgi:hypothetical protein
MPATHRTTGVEDERVPRSDPWNGDRARFVTVHSRRLRALLFVPAVLLAGAVTSAVNGELGSHLWAVFVSFDSVLVGLGVMFGLALTRLRLPHVRASQRPDG